MAAPLLWEVSPLKAGTFQRQLRQPQLRIIQRLHQALAEVRSIYIHTQLWGVQMTIVGTNGLEQFPRPLPEDRGASAPVP